MAQAHAGLKLNGEHLSPYRRAVPDPADRKLFRYDASDGQWSIATADSIELLSTENAVKIVDVKPEGETNVELLIDPGVTGALAIQDAAGNPLTATRVAGLTEHRPITYLVTESSATIYALNPDGAPRSLALYHPQRQLGGMATIRGDEQQPVIAKLEVMGRLTGRILDADGLGLAGVEVAINPSLSGNGAYRFAPIPSDRTITAENGRFELPAIVPGMKFSLQARQGEMFLDFNPKLGRISVKSGETRDVGDCTTGPSRPNSQSSPKKVGNRPAADSQIARRLPLTRRAWPKTPPIETNGRARVSAQADDACAFSYPAK